MVSGDHFGICKFSKSEKEYFVIVGQRIKELAEQPKKAKSMFVSISRDSNGSLTAMLHQF